MYYTMTSVCVCMCVSTIILSARNRFFHSLASRGFCTSYSATMFLQLGLVALRDDQFFGVENPSKNIDAIH